MKLFQFSKSSYDVIVSEEAFFITHFKRILDRDKSKDKELAMKELAFIFFYADITSPYQSILDNKEREEEIKKDISLPLKWKLDQSINDAVTFYKEKSKTAVHHLYESSMTAAAAVNEVLGDAKALIEESQDRIGAVQKVIGALEKVPKVMASLRDIEKELLKQIEDKEGKKLGSKSFSLYEEGLNLD
jgi:hypothetical protein